MAQNDRHETKGPDDGQHRKIFPVAGQDILPPVERLQVINQVTGQRQQRTRSDGQNSRLYPNDRTVSSTIFLSKEFSFKPLGM